jgi:hypothetical protein
VPEALDADVGSGAPEAARQITEAQVVLVLEPDEQHPGRTVH